MTKYICLFTYLCLLFIQPVHSAEESPVSIELIAENQTVQPGKPFWVALRFHINEGWHTYWKNPGEMGMPMKVEWTLPADYKIDSFEWPVPLRFDNAGINGYGYEGDVVFLTQITPSSSTPIEKQAELIAHVSWLVCSSTTCLPGKGDAKLVVNTDNKTPLLNEKMTQIFADARRKIPQKQGPFQVKRHTDGRLQVQLPSNHPFENKEEWSIDFYPSNEGHINSAEKPQFVDSNAVILKEQQGETHLLQGVLVFTGKETYAFEIDSPIEQASSAIALADHQATTTTPVVTNNAPKDFEGGLALALVFAFVGGMLLNLMPCVLPVISFKIMGFIQIAGQSRSLIFKHGLLFSLGVILSFWCLAGLMLVLQAYGESVGWGFQLQEPIFIAILSALMLIIGLNMFGLFEVGLSVASWAGQTQADAKKESGGLFNSFLSGILATAVATPCTGPFLGSAVGFAFTLSAPLALLVFTFLGLGMAFPYLLLSIFPSFLRFLPKPGAWMVTFKEIVGFVMMATVLWLVWIFGAQTSNMAVTLLLLSFLFVSMACWIYGKWSVPTTHRFERSVAYICAIGLIALSGLVIMTATSSSMAEDHMIAYNSSSGGSTRVGSIEDWEPFSLERIAELQKAGTPVFVDFTAKWCLICQANHLVLSQEEVTSKMAAQGVVKMKADWTKNDETITEELRKFGRNSVPLYVFYGAPDEQPRILPQILTADVISEHLDAIADNSK